MPNDDVIQQNIEIGARIASLREELGMTQEELARKVGYTASSSRSTIQKIEAGKSGVPTSKMPKFAEALGTTVPYLMGLEEEQEDDELLEYLEELRTRPEMKMLFDSSRHMSIDQVKAIVAMIERFRDDSVQ